MTFLAIDTSIVARGPIIIVGDICAGYNIIIVGANNN